MSRTAESYVAGLRSQAGRVVAVRWNPAWALDVAVSEPEWEAARSLLAVELSHLGEGKMLQVRQHRDGAWWSDPMAGPQRRVVPWTQPFHEWGDETTGRIRTRLVWTMPSPVEEAGKAGACAAWLAEHPAAYGGRGREAALAIAADLASGAMAEAVRRAAEVMVAGLDDPRAVAMIGEAFRARVALEALAMVASDAVLIDALAIADSALEGFGEAVLLVDDALYAGISQKQPLDEHAWWGARARLEQEIPSESLSTALRERRPLGAAPELVDAHGSGHGARGNEGVFLAAAAEQDLASAVESVGSAAGLARRTAFEHTMQQLSHTPAPWMREDIARVIEAVASRSDGDPDLAWRAAAMSETTSPAPGRTPLALYLPEQNEGVVLELRIERGPGALWAGPVELQALARDAIRTAHAALAALSHSGQPRLRLEDHCVRIVGPARLLEAIRGIDGESIALPAALAFASLWLERCLPRDLAATGVLERDGASVGRVGRAGTAAKARALAAWGRGQRVRLLLPQDNVHDAGADVEVQPVAGLSSALALAGLSLESSTSWCALGDVAERIAGLESLVRDVKTHNLGRHGIEGMDPWMVLADRTSLVVQSLQRDAQGMERTLLDTARAYAALAYTHAGDERAAAMFPVDMPVDAHTPPPVRVFKLFSQLVSALGTASLATCTPLIDALDGAMGELRADERAWMAGLVRGTQGRAWMHARELPEAERLARALPLLREAVEHHARHAPTEVARSRIYLATALRMAGHLDEAAEELRKAAQELENHTRPWSGAYYRATSMYLAYERARLRVARGWSRDDLLAAVRDTDDALREANERGGFWPALGLLRTRAWAFHLLGDVAQARRAEEMARIVAAHAPDGARAMVSRITTELDSPNAPGGEVY